MFVLGRGWVGVCLSAGQGVGVLLLIDWFYIALFAALEQTHTACCMGFHMNE